MSFREKMKHEFWKDRGQEEKYLFGKTKEEMLQESNEDLRERNRKLDREKIKLEKKMDEGLFLDKSDLKRLREKEEDFVRVQSVGNHRYKIIVRHEGERISVLDE